MKIFRLTHMFCVLRRDWYPRFFFVATTDFLYFNHVHIHMVLQFFVEVQNVEQITENVAFL
jgi:hypothetical protein